MSKKHNKTSKLSKNVVSGYSFSSLLTYCNKNQIENFNETLRNHPVSSIVLNDKILSSDELLNQFPNLKKSESDSILYRFDKDENRLGKSLEHFIGGFYILDPSSAYISYQLEKILNKNFISIDLCSAPGGKTISLDLRRREGTYLCNDISYERAIEIDKNIQRMALDNVMTISMDPMKLNLKECFDLVILDAPCSGSGMIRKEKKMILDYSEEKVERLIPIQKNLLEKAYQLCKKDGIISYSTCSLSTKEDEDVVKDFLSRHSDVELIHIDVDKSIIETIGYHLVPGIYDGEGIYFALLKKHGGESNSLTEIKFEDSKRVFKYKSVNYQVKTMYDELKSLPFISPGIKIDDTSEYKKCPFDHAYSKVSDDIEILQLTREQALSYIQGNELKIDTSDGYKILAYKKGRLGFGKAIQGRIKNYLPKGLRGYLF